MTAPACEVTITGGGAGFGHEDHPCGAEAALLVNGFPMCAEHETEYAAEGLIESRERLPEQAATPVPDPLDEIISIIFRQGERSWLSGTTHASEGEADAFARGMLGHRGDDERDGAFTYDSFEVVRYRRVRGAGPATSPPPVASTPPASNEETPPW